MTDPDVLYHYTGATGLIGIIEEKVLWATDAEFLNDAQELRFGRSELRDALLKKANELAPGSSGGARTADESRATVMLSVADHLEPGGMFLREQAHRAYVVCFCEEGDLLSQWRAYGVSGGYAIGFRTSQLRAIHSLYIGAAISESVGIRFFRKLRPQVRIEWGPSLPVQLVQVKYGREAVDAVVEEVLRDVAPNPTGHPGVRGFFQAQSLVFPALASIKHDAFQEEREWRLIIVGSRGEETASFRPGPLGVIPYVMLEFPSEAVAEVVVGPGREQDVWHRGVERLVGERLSGDVEVRKSRAPFRG